MEPPSISLPYPAPELGDGTVVLRKWGMGDLECVRLAATDPDIPIGTTVPAVFSPEAGAAFVERQWGRLADGEGVSLALTASGMAVGVVTLAPRWVLGLPHVRRVEAHVDVGNTPSRRTLESAGFQQEGVLRRYLAFGGAVADAAVYSMVS